MVFRIPRWLRWLIDFEIVTGDDLDPMVKAEKIQPYIKYLEKKENDKAKQKTENKDKELIKGIEILLNKIQLEFYTYPYKDKYNSYVGVFENRKCKCVEYKFENGDSVLFSILDENCTTGESIFEIKFTPKTTLANAFSVKSYGKRLYESAKNLLVDITTKSVERVIKEEKKMNVALKNKYNLIVRKIKTRQEELNKLDKNAPTYNSLLTELNTYKRMADKLKKQL